MSESTSTEVATRDDSIGGLVAKYRDDFSLVLPSHMNGDQWVRVVQGVLRRNATLANVAKKNPGSLLAALLDCARQGLEPGDTYYLVPFGNEIVGIPSYVGEIEKIYRAGEVSSIKAEIVYANDKFVFAPHMDRPQHEPDWFSDRGEMIGVYAYAVMKDGSTSRVVMMSRDDVMKIKAVSKTARQSDSPWNKWEDRMWLKTAIHQLKRWIPSSAEYRQATIRANATVETVAPALIEQAPALDYDDTDLDSNIVDAEIVDDEEPAMFDASAIGDQGAAPAMATQAQMRAVHALLKKHHPDDDRHEVLTQLIGRTITSASEVTKDEAGWVIEHFNKVEEGSAA